MGLLGFRGNRRRTPSQGMRPVLVRAARAAGRGLRRAVPWVLGAALLAGVGWSVQLYVKTSPYFRLRDLDISGQDRLSEEELRAWTGLSPHAHMLRIRPEQMAARLEEHPWVLAAQVQRTLPDRLAIRIAERRPGALILVERPLELDNGYLLPSGLHLIDTRGVPLLGEPGQHHRLPVITGLTRAAGVVSFSSLLDRSREALAVVRQWHKQRLPSLAGLSEVHLDPVLGVVLFTEEQSIRVQLGWRDHPARLTRLREVLTDLKAEGRRPEYVLLDDEMAPERVSVGLAGSTPSKTGPGAGPKHPSRTRG